MPHSHLANSIIGLCMAKSEGHPPYPTERGSQSNEVIVHLIDTITACWGVDPANRPKMQQSLTVLHECTISHFIHLYLVAHILTI
jgi:hypothetical protein